VSLVRQVPTIWGAAQSERTLAGDVVSTRRVHFRSQEEQIEFLRELVDEYRGHAGIRARARDIVFRQANCPPRDEVAYALAIGRWVQSNITYVRELPEQFATPVHTLLIRCGDCDDFASVTASLLEGGLGIESELVGMSWETPADPGGAFGHIFCRAVVRGQRIPLDATLEFPIEALTDPIEVGRQRRLPGLRIMVA
jgi:transglutaminase-like putative cysteine protease